MTRQQLLEHLRQIDTEWLVKTDNTHSEEARGGNLVTVRFWVEEESNETNAK